MPEGSIEVPAAAAQRIRNLAQSIQQLQQVYDMTFAMLAEALQIPQGWQLVEIEGKMLFTSMTPVGEEQQAE